MMEEISKSFCCCSRQQSNGRRRRSRREMNMGRRGPLFTVALLLLSALLPSAIASSTSRLRGKKRRTKSLYNGVPQHGAQRPSVPSQYDENMRKLILIASSSNKNNYDEREEARRILATIMGNTDEADQQHRELAQKKINGNNKRTKQQRTKQQRQRIKRLNAQRKKKNAERQKKKQMMQILKQQSSQKEKDNKDDKDDKQTDGKFSFGPPPPEKPKPQNSAGSFSAYQTGNSMADAFVDSLASSFVSNGGGGGGGGGSSSTAEIQEASSSVSSSRDTQIDGFETSPSKLDWEFSTKNPWKVTSDASYEGRSSMMSGLPPSSKNVVVGKSLYSNMTLSLTNEDLNQAIGKGKDGAVLSFQVKATEALSWPISSFMVTLNDKMVLSPSETESFASSMWKKNEWAEFSIVIDTVAGSSAKYDVKFIHVANPLKLDKLPDVPDALKLYIDDVRLAPFTRKVEPLEIEMTTSFSGSKWNEVTGVYVATSASIGKESGHVDLNLVVYSRLGGRLKYQLKTSTQGPFDDLATLINGKLQDAQFGESANFEYAEVEIPRGKAVITIRHRKNPGNLTSNTLGKLGTVTTEGTNRVKNIEFVATQ